MKRITIILILLISTLGFSQSLPIDFSDPLDAMNCFDCTFSLTTDAGNDVGSIAGGGLPFDTAQLPLAENLDLSDDTNNTISFRVKPIADYGTRIHLLKFEGGTGPNVELSFTTVGTAWQNISLNFGPGLGNYSLMVIFTDFNNASIGTYLFDDIAGGTNVAPPPPPPTPAIPAPIPNTPVAEVYSLYGDSGGFTNLSFLYSFGTLAGELDLDPDPVIVNNALQFDFSVAGWGAGYTTTDVSSAQYVHFDYWTTDAVELKFFVISELPTVVEATYDLPTEEALVYDTWTSVTIPMSHFTAQGFASSSAFQYKFDVTSNLFPGIVYIDNVYFSNVLPTALSVDEFETSKFKHYPNPSSKNWSIESENIVTRIELYDISGKMISSRTPMRRNFDIDGSQFPVGLYFAKLKTLTGSHSIKLVKK